ncbi:MAG: universal stress protein [Candidatus Hydrothermarchaeota archaeon]
MKVLVPVDGSKGSYAALKVGMEFAERFGGELAVLVVTPELAFDEAIQEELQVLMERCSREILEGARRAAVQAGMRAEEILARGDPAEEILRHARGCDLVVMGSRGLSGLRRLLLGSVSRRVADQAPCSVLLVR